MVGLSPDIDKLDLDALRTLVLELLEGQVLLREENVLLRAENNRLKGLNGRPDIKPPALRPSGMDKKARSRAKSGRKSNKTRRGAKKGRVAIDERRVIEVDAPPGSKFKGYEDYLVQDIYFRPHTVLLRRERRLTSDGRSLVAPLPTGTKGHFGPELRRFVLAQYHGAQTTVGRLLNLLRDFGVDISKRQVMRLLTEGHESFIEEGQATLRAGLKNAPWISVDDTGARHGGRNGVTTQIGNDTFAWFATTLSKSRVNFLELLRAGHNDYVINDAALAYMSKRSLTGSVIRLLRDAKCHSFQGAAAFASHLESLGVPALKVHPNPLRIATEGALWGSLVDHGMLDNGVILSDGAGQFNIGHHALCWVHSERLIHKLDTFTEHQRKQQKRIKTRFWWLYADLKNYRQNPNKKRRRELRRRFDALFTTKTGFVTLDRLLARIHARKSDLLVVLDRPEVPLHTNGSENDIRTVVTRRKVSGCTHSEAGKQCRDTFLGLMKTCQKLEISFWAYLGDRLKVPGAEMISPLPELVKNRCMNIA
jgi:hypothetical protein